ncbi:MAG: type II toxin-antitoxin system MqsA family antitoxin [Tepidanaerobacteraceae bacterium]|nr:type II toxin-antitoxin system MqsA family antitoxin [Tepidanaerobacteraceae bacterium]
MNKCQYCNGKLIKNKGRTEKWVNNRLIIIENVPFLVCEDCGEKYYDAETSLKLDEYLYEAKPEKIIEVPVFVYKEG